MAEVLVNFLRTIGCHPWKRRTWSPRRCVFVFFSLTGDFSEVWQGFGAVRFTVATFFLRRLFFKRQGDKQVWCCIYRICLKFSISWLWTSMNSVVFRWQQYMADFQAERIGFVLFFLLNWTPGEALFVGPADRAMLADRGSFRKLHTVDVQKSGQPVEVGSLSHYFQGFIHHCFFHRISEPSTVGITIFWDSFPETISVHLRSLRNDAESWQRSVLQMFFF